MTPLPRLYVCCSAHPEDQAWLTDLRKHLTNKAELVDRQQVPAGLIASRWVAQAIAECSRVLVLWSADLLADDFYAQAEGPALQKRIAEGAVLPVQLRPADLPPDLAALRRLPDDGPALSTRPGRDAVLCAVADPICAGLARTWGDLLGIAVRLDRTEAWGKLAEICAGPEDAVMVLHGHRRQGLHFFLDRLEAFLQGHLLVPVALDLHDAPVTSAAELEHFYLHEALREALARSRLPDKGKSEQLLARALERHPVLIVLGHEVLSETRQEDPETWPAVGDFVAQRLGALVRRARGPAGKPVRILLAVEHDGGAALPAPAQTVYGWAQGAGLRAELLPELKMPKWPDVEDTLKRLLPSEPAVIARLQRQYDRVQSDDSFAALVDWLHREIRPRRTR